ncbi:MAG TPA: acyl-CoA dehydrogenase, partial [Ilumatobacteraceae bacterium]|nr:acyl-CoA dehydrogenase [Ilumatobacteraceae bacterium]
EGREIVGLDAGLDDDLADLLDGLRAFLRAEVMPRHEADPALADPRTMFGADGRFRDDVLHQIRAVRRAAADAGYYTMLAPPELGGGGVGFEGLFRAWELIYEECGPHHFLGYWALAHWARGPSRVLLELDAAEREQVLPDLLSGEHSMCFAMSEPDAGSDAWAMRTTATRAGDGWVINGTKQWITNGPYAEHTLVFAVTDADAARAHRGGISAFLIDADAPGYRVDSVIAMFGHAGGDEAILSFDDVFVPDRRRVGALGDGMRIAMSGVSSGRLYNTARSVGLARWALAQAFGHTEQRQAFGRKIIEFQGISHRLATAAIELRAARLLGLDCAKRLDAGASGRSDLAAAKVFATEMAARAIDTAVQAHGAMGFTNEMGLAEAWQQVRRIQVADGSAEVLRNQVVKSIRAGEW